MRAAYLRSGFEWLLVYGITVAFLFASIFMVSFGSPGDMLDLSFFFKMLAYFGLTIFCSGYAVAAEKRLEGQTWGGRRQKAKRLFAKYITVFSLLHLTFYLVVGSLNLRAFGTFEWGHLLYFTGVAALLICIFCYLAELYDNEDSDARS